MRYYHYVCMKPLRTSNLLIIICITIQPSLSLSLFQSISRWKKRYFLLDGYNLKYYNNEEEAEDIMMTPRGIIPLAGAELYQAIHAVYGSQYMEIHLPTMGAKYPLACEKNEEYQQWLETLIYVINLSITETENNLGTVMSAVEQVVTNQQQQQQQSTVGGNELSASKKKKNTITGTTPLTTTTPSHSYSSVASSSPSTTAVDSSSGIPISTLSPLERAAKDLSDLKLQAENIQTELRKNELVSSRTHDQEVFQMQIEDFRCQGSLAKNKAWLNQYQTNSVEPSSISSPVIKNSSNGDPLIPLSSSASVPSPPVTSVPAVTVSVSSPVSPPPIPVPMVLLPSVPVPNAPPSPALSTVSISLADDIETAQKIMEEATLTKRAAEQETARAIQTVQLTHDRRQLLAQLTKEADDNANNVLLTLPSEYNTATYRNNNSNNNNGGRTPLSFSLPPSTTATTTTVYQVGALSSPPLYFHQQSTGTTSPRVRRGYGTPGKNVHVNGTIRKNDNVNTNNSNSSTDPNQTNIVFPSIVPSPETTTINHYHHNPDVPLPSSSSSIYPSAAASSVSVSASSMVMNTSALSSSSASSIPSLSILSNNVSLLNNSDLNLSQTIKLLQETEQKMEKFTSLLSNRNNNNNFSSHHHHTTNSTNTNATKKTIMKLDTKGSSSTLSMSSSKSQQRISKSTTLTTSSTTEPQPTAPTATPGTGSRSTSRVSVNTPVNATVSSSKSSSPFAKIHPLPPPPPAANFTSPRQTKKSAAIIQRAQEKLQKEAAIEAHLLEREQETMQSTNNNKYVSSSSSASNTPRASPAPDHRTTSGSTTAKEKSRLTSGVVNTSVDSSSISSYDYNETQDQSTTNENSRIYDDLDQSDVKETILNSETESNHQGSTVEDHVSPVSRRILQKLQLAQQEHTLPDFERTINEYSEVLSSLFTKYSPTDTTMNDANTNPPPSTTISTSSVLSLCDAAEITTDSSISSLIIEEIIYRIYRSSSSGNRTISSSSAAATTTNDIVISFPQFISVLVVIALFLVPDDHNKNRTGKDTDICALRRLIGKYFLPSVGTETVLSSPSSSSAVPSTPPETNIYSAILTTTGASSSPSVSSPSLASATDALSSLAERIKNLMIPSPAAVTSSSSSFIRIASPPIPYPAEISRNIPSTDNEPLDLSELISTQINSIPVENTVADTTTNPRNGRLMLLDPRDLSVVRNNELLPPPPTSTTVYPPLRKPYTTNEDMLHHRGARLHSPSLVSPSSVPTVTNSIIGSSVGGSIIQNRSTTTGGTILLSSPSASSASVSPSRPLTSPSSPSSSASIVPVSILRMISPITETTMGNIAIRSAFQADHKPLSIIFHHYADLRVSNASNNHASASVINATVASISHIPHIHYSHTLSLQQLPKKILLDRHVLFFNDVSRFAHDFDIIPSLVSPAILQQLYLNIATPISVTLKETPSRHPSSIGTGTNTTQPTTTTVYVLKLEGFLEWLGRIAVLSFHMRGPLHEPGQAALHLLRHLDASDGRKRMVKETRGERLLRFSARTLFQ